MKSENARIRANTKKLRQLSPKEAQELHEIEQQAIARFQGQLDDLEAALGMLKLGIHFGWKPLAIIHNKRTLRKYEEILGINIREYLPPEGPSADRSLGLQIANRLNEFWKVVSGDIKDDELKMQRREVA